jgi:molecular chaperone GrpE
MAESDRRPGREDESGVASSDRADVGIEDVLDELRRERADFLNYKRRVERDRASEREASQGDLLRYLLPFLDELDRALGLIPRDLENHPWAQGIALSRGRLSSAFDDLAVERVGAEGEPFDPARHEALFFDTDPGASDQRVASVVRPGYRVGNRLVRPAQVGVVGPDPHGASQQATTDGADERRDAAARQGQAAHPTRGTQAGG